MKEKPAGGIRPFGPRNSRVDAKVAGQIPTHRAVVGSDTRMSPIPRRHSPFFQRKSRVGNDPIWIRCETNTQAGTVRTGSLRAVEGEMAGREARCPVTGFRIFRLGGEQKVRLAGRLGKIGGSEGDDQTTLAEPHGEFQG
ncbi:MAG: hypothetical protein EBW11_00125, partial [Betaproteobacteria bacterium]|nr:hypothetical protein [Betaproteobacteria bacterium]